MTSQYVFSVQSRCIKYKHKLICIYASALGDKKQKPTSSVYFEYIANMPAGPCCDVTKGGMFKVN